MVRISKISQEVKPDYNDRISKPTKFADIVNFAENCKIFYKIFLHEMLVSFM